MSRDIAPLPLSCRNLSTDTALCRDPILEERGLVSCVPVSTAPLEAPIHPVARNRGSECAVVGLARRCADCSTVLTVQTSGSRVQHLPIPVVAPVAARYRSPLTCDSPTFVAQIAPYRTLSAGARLRLWSAAGLRRARITSAPYRGRPAGRKRGERRVANPLPA